MNRNKVLAARSPYIELFGVDGMGKGRPGMESKASGLLPVNDLPPLELVGGKDNAVRIRRTAAGRAMTALRAMFAAEYRRVYKKEMMHLSLLQAKENGVELTPALAKKYGFDLPNGGVRRVGTDSSGSVVSDGDSLPADSSGLDSNLFDQEQGKGEDNG